MRPSGERIHRHIQEDPPATFNKSQNLVSRIGHEFSTSFKKAWVESTDYTRLAAHVTSPAMVNSALEASGFLLRNPQISQIVGATGVYIGGLLIFGEIRKTDFYQKLVSGPRLRSDS